MLLQSYILMAILFISPLHSNSYQEDPIERLGRYISIAEDIEYNVNHEPLLFSGKFAKEKTAIMQVSMMKHESNFNKDVDAGKKRGVLGEVCLLQIIPNMQNKYNYSVKYLLNRKNCLKASLEIARGVKCSNNINSMMRAYASGRCAKHPDPKKEKIIKAAAYGEVKGYLRFIAKYPPK